MEFKSAMESLSRITFQSPPINELVIGIRFPPVLELKAQHIGIYWQSIRDRFPECVQQPPHIVVAEGSPDWDSPKRHRARFFPYRAFGF